jgi:protein SCO1
VRRERALRFAGPTDKPTLKEQQMSTLKFIRTVAWAAVVAAVIALGALFAGSGWLSGLDRRALPLAASIGGPFKLTTHLNAPFTDQQLKGKPFAIFFGFTNCPDVCPTTLLEITNRIAELGPLADNLNYVFVTVDPKADTVEHLKTYLSNFDRRIIGLTGSEEEINEIVARYRVVVQRVPTKAGYTINHTATTFLMDRDGRLAGTLAYEEPAKFQLAKLSRLAGGS